MFNKQECSTEELAKNLKSEHSSIVKIGQTLLGMVLPDFIINFYKGHVKDKNKKAKNYLKVSRSKVGLEILPLREEKGTGERYTSF